MHPGLFENAVLDDGVGIDGGVIVGGEGDVYCWFNLHSSLSARRVIVSLSP